MNTEMNLFEMDSRSPAAPMPTADCDGVALAFGDLRAMRRRLHELANVFTGMVIAGGLLRERVEAEELRRYAAEICEGGQRGCELVCELRQRLLACESGERGEEGGAEGPSAPRSQESCSNNSV